MESCTGGALASSITNIPGCSDVFEEGLVTYSNRVKVKHGISKKIIDKFGVFSQEVAEEMAKKIGGDIGVGVTGELPGVVFYSIRVKLRIANYKLSFKTPLPASGGVSPLEKGRVARRIKMKRVVVKKVFESILDLI